MLNRMLAPPVCGGICKDWCYITKTPQRRYGENACFSQLGMNLPGGKEGEEREEAADAVVLATGGFGANQQLLQQWCPSACGLPTTNGEWATGDGLDLGREAGAAFRDLDKVGPCCPPSHSR